MAKALVISDVHGNLAALRSVLESARGWDELVVLGDLVDYGPRPADVIDLIRSYSPRAVMGNHDNAAAFRVDCMCGEETHWVSVWFRENVTLRLLDKDDLAYLASLPNRLELDGALRALAVHGSPSSPLYGYLYPWLSDDQASSMLSEPGLRLSSIPLNRSPSGAPRPAYDLYLVGHTHYQLYRVVRGRAVVNPGSVGQPRDGDPRASYAVVDLDGGAVELRRVRYNVDEVLRDLEGLGVPEPYMGALKHMFLMASTPPRQQAHSQA